MFTLSNKVVTLNVKPKLYCVRSPYGEVDHLPFHTSASGFGWCCFLQYNLNSDILIVMVGGVTSAVCTHMDSDSNTEHFCAFPKG